MSHPDATFCHPDQSTRLGHYYNDNYSIPNSKRIWDFRDRLYSGKVNMSMWQNGDLEAFCHKGSNAPEFFHRNTTDCFDYLKKEPVHIDRLPGIAIMQKLAHNLKRARLIKERKFRAMEYDPDNYHIHDTILIELEKLISLDFLRDDARKCDILPHHYLYFNNTDKTVDAFLYGFKWENSIVRVTGIDHEDKELLWHYIKKYEDQLVATNGCYYNTESLKFLQEKMKYKMSIPFIKRLIQKYWIHDDDLFFKVIQELKLPIQSESSDEDEDEDEVKKDCKFIENDYDTSPVKNKKKSEYVISFILI